MTRLLALALLGLSLDAMAQVPDPVITTLSSFNGHGTIAGNLSAKVEAPVGISVANGGIRYSTLTDADGRW